MISVVIPLYNKEHQIAETLRSVLEQTFQDFEVVIVDDGSTDKSAEEALKIRDPRIRLVRQENAGVSSARNRGIEEARFDLIAFLDADDRWKPEYLQTQYDLFQKYPQCGVFACNYEFVHADGSIHPTVIRKLAFEGQDGILDNYFEVASCSHPPICSISIMVRKEALLRIGGFPVGIRSGEDLLTWARLACQYQIAYSLPSQAQYVQTSSSSYAPPPDIECIDDSVATGLRKLFLSYSKDGRYKHMIGYLAFWYKMRSRINLSLGNRRASIACAAASLQCRITLKPVVFIVLAFMPKFITSKLV